MVCTTCTKDEEEKYCPSCEITNPLEGDIIQRGQLITISVDADDPDGYIDEVNFYTGGHRIGSVKNSPYKHSWNTSDAPYGKQKIAASSVDNDGLFRNDVITVFVFDSIPEPPDTDTVTDYEGNTYVTVEIGDQWWMAENFAATKFIDGTAIPNVTDGDEWGELTTPAYCWYDNDEATYKDTYGALYNWYVVETGKLCPTGWHVPTNDEWTELIDYLGGDSIAGGKLCKTGNPPWPDPNTGATNESGFSALPGGSRVIDNHFPCGGVCFTGFEFVGAWWTSSEYSSTEAWSLTLIRGDKIEIFRGRSIRQNGYSVRCVKD